MFFCAEVHLGVAFLKVSRGGRIRPIQRERYKRCEAFSARQKRTRGGTAYLTPSVPKGQRVYYLEVLL